MKIIAISILSVLSLSTSIVQAQQISISSISPGGNWSANGSLQLESSLGEFASPFIQNGNLLLTQGFTQPYIPLSAPLPVLGLEFNAKRINNKNVQLNWKTVQEIDNKGFYVERKKENEANYLQLRFVKSAAPNGHASLPLHYSHIDTNSFAGKTYYRLKQQDLLGTFLYSTVRLVDGSNKKVTSLKAWPIPSTGPVNISAEGIEKDMILVFDNNGRLIKQLTITSQTPVQLTGLLPGTYIIKLGSQKELYHKIIVQ